MYVAEHIQLASPLDQLVGRRHNDHFVDYPLIFFLLLKFGHKFKNEHYFLQY